jgi:shikimate kinase
LLNLDNIIFIGLSGSGKSSVASLLAAESKRILIDCDRAIEDAAGISISEIFAKEGEEHFRHLENELLNSLLARAEEGSLNSAVIACGGGMPIAAGNLDKLNRIGRTIYLTATLAELCRRIENEKHRPLLTGSLAEKISQQHKSRHNTYARAHMTIDTSAKSQEEVVSEVQRILTNTTL